LTQAPRSAAHLLSFILGVQARKLEQLAKACMDQHYRMLGAP